MEGEDTIIDVDDTALLNDLGKILVVNVHDFVIAFGSVLIVCSDDEFVVCSDGDIDVADRIPSTDFRTFGVEGNCERAARLGLFSSTRIVNHALMVLLSVVLKKEKYLITAVTKVHANDVHAGFA